jgi:hypothetical protein
MEAAIRTSGFRQKVIVVANQLYIVPFPCFFPELNELNNLWTGDNAPVLLQSIVYKIELVTDFDYRKDIHRSEVRLYPRRSGEHSGAFLIYATSFVISSDTLSNSPLTSSLSAYTMTTQRFLSCSIFRFVSSVFSLKADKA